MDKFKGSLERGNTAEVKPEDQEQRKAWRPEALGSAAEEAQQVARLQEQVISASQREMRTPFIGISPEIQKTFELIERVADTDSSVLISGESGTGKELVAKALHMNSSRRNKSFVPVNCGAIPGELLESELFGHVKGAYTGAHSTRMGRFSLAHQGTLFLDEISNMPTNLQVKLLRALQEKEFEPVGGTKTLRSDCRVLAATNDDLEMEVSNGGFREDLFYRLNVIPIHLPPLRKRKEDIPLLLDHFLQLFNKKKDYQVEGFSSEALEVLSQYHWPGNVRELENICQRLCILKAKGRIELADIPAKLRQPKPLDQKTRPWGQWLSQGLPEEGLSLEELVLDFENDLICQALERTNWNKNKAAQLLNMNRTTLVEKIKKRDLKKD